jgi:hypothetical protein
MAGTGIRKPEPVQIKGLAAAGQITCALPLGSQVFGAINISSGANESSNFETVTTVAGQLKQTGSGLGSNEYWIYAVPGS